MYLEKTQNYIRKKQNKRIENRKPEPSIDSTIQGERGCRLRDDDDDEFRLYCIVKLRNLSSEMNTILVFERKEKEIEKRRKTQNTIDKDIRIVYSVLSSFSRID